MISLHVYIFGVCFKIITVLLQWSCSGLDGAGLQLSQMNKLQGCRRRECPALAQLLQCKNPSCENSQLMRLFWLHPSSLLSACRHSPLLISCPHPPSSPFSILVFLFPLLFFRLYWCEERFCGRGWWDMAADQPFEHKCATFGAKGVKSLCHAWLKHFQNCSQIKVGFGWNLNIYISIYAYIHALVFESSVISFKKC